MQKDFDTWNNVKKKTQAEFSRLYTVREVWWCRLGVNVGSEQDGKGAYFVRPCVIVRGFGPDACLVVPLTTSPRKHFLRVEVGSIDGKQARANISQLKVVDTRRLEEKIGFIDKDKFSELQKHLRKLF